MHTEKKKQIEESKYLRTESSPSLKTMKIYEEISHRMKDGNPGYLPSFILQLCLIEKYFLQRAVYFAV